jgi:hypothetical protein
VWETQKEYLKNAVGKCIYYGVRDISRLLSVMLAKKQSKITYRTRVEVDAYVP